LCILLLSYLYPAAFLPRWSTKFADNGFIKIARGINCGNITEADWNLFTYGDPAKYYEQ
jgi:hypothetical protein